MTAEDTTTLTSARLDLWLWSVRIFKTRSLAADECKGGHARQRRPCQTLSKTQKGDVVRVRYPGWEHVFKVEKLLVKRVGAPIAVTCYEDLSGPRPAYLSMPPVAKRERGSGRPTKKERRAPRRTTRPRRLTASRTPISQSAPARAQTPPRRRG